MYQQSWMRRGLRRKHPLSMRGGFLHPWQPQRRPLHRRTDAPRRPRPASLVATATATATAGASSAAATTTAAAAAASLWLALMGAYAYTDNHNPPASETHPPDHSWTNEIHVPPPPPWTIFGGAWRLFGEWRDSWNPVTVRCESQPQTSNVDHIRSSSSSSDHSNVSANTGTTIPAIPKSKLLFVGSGSSTGCPRPLCTLIFASPQTDTKNGPDDSDDDDWVQQLRTEWAPYCRTSAVASQGNPLLNKDYRNNPSLLISVVVENEAFHQHSNALSKNNTDNIDDDGMTLTPMPPPQWIRKNVIIDVGKTFREGALRWFPQAGIRSLDAIVLTHEHMDAAGGLDDVRGFQAYRPRASLPAETVAPGGASTQKQSLSSSMEQVPMPLFLSHHCLSCLQTLFPWLLPTSVEESSSLAGCSCSKNTEPVSPTASSATPTTTVPVTRHVASFDVSVFEAFQPFDVLPGGHLSITPLPVMHGEDLVSFGFAFTIGGGSSSSSSSSNGEAMNVVYLSDISRMLPETLEYIQTKLPQPTHVLILDALCIHQDNPVHYNLGQALALTREIQPEQTYLMGMNCDLFPLHDEMNEKLQLEVRDQRVQLAHDGLVLNCRELEDEKNEKRKI